MGLQTSHWHGQPGGGHGPRGGRSRAWRPFIRRNELFAVPGVGEDEPVIIFKFAIIDLGKSYYDKNELIIKFISEINSAAIRQLAAGAGAAGRASPPPSPRAKGARALRAAAGSVRSAAFRAPLPRARREPAFPTRRRFCLWGGAGATRRPGCPALSRGRPRTEGSGGRDCFGLSCSNVLEIKAPSTQMAKVWFGFDPAKASVFLFSPSPAALSCRHPPSRGPRASHQLHSQSPAPQSTFGPARPRPAPCPQLLPPAPAAPARPRRTLRFRERAGVIMSCRRGH